LVLLNVNPRLAEEYRGDHVADLRDHRMGIMNRYGVPETEAEILVRGDAEALIAYLRAEYEAGRFFVVIC
jgi:hypothetical protein